MTWRVRALICLVGAILAGAGAAPARATTIDFTTGLTFDTSSTYPRITSAAGGAVTFSENVAGIWPDGFSQTSTSTQCAGIPGAYNLYGESGEYMSFAAPVWLQSIDVRASLPGAPSPTTMTFLMYDASNNLLGQVTIAPPATYQTLNLGVTGVAKLVIDWTGGSAYYAPGDTTNHAWYAIDNLTYSTALPAPEPASIALIAAGACLAAIRRRQRIGAA